MSRRSIVAGILGLTLVSAVSAASAQENFATRLRGFEEVPTLSSFGGGTFTATINEDGTEVDWTLSYFNLRTPVQQSHIHLGQAGTNGGIMVFFCTNLENGPVGTATCPNNPGQVPGTFSGQLSGSFSAAEVVAGAAAQGVGPGEIVDVLRAMRSGFSYINVHTVQYPGGELRGQLRGQQQINNP